MRAQVPKPRYGMFQISLHSALLTLAPAGLSKNLSLRVSLQLCGVNTHFGPVKVGSGFCQWSAEQLPHSRPFSGSHGMSFPVFPAPGQVMRPPDIPWTSALLRTAQYHGASCALHSADTKLSHWRSVPQSKLCRRSHQLKQCPPSKELSFRLSTPGRSLELISSMGKSSFVPAVALASAKA